MEDLANYLTVPDFATLLTRFIHDQVHPTAPVEDDSELPPAYYRFVMNPQLCKVFIFSSAAATFYAPSDVSGTGGMRRERIRATPSWRKGPPRYDCAFIETDPDASGMKGLHVARVRLLFSFQFANQTYPCALVEWFEPISEDPDELTGLWIVEPEFREDGTRERSVVHLDTIVRAAHLIGVYGNDSLPHTFHFSNSLDVFRAFYVNKYVDHHSHEIAF